MILLDTDVMIDILRRHQPALLWLDSLDSEVTGLSGLVAMELLQGCRNRLEQQHVERILQRYVLYWPGQAER